MSRVLTLAGGAAGLVLLFAACAQIAGPGQPAVPPPTGSSGLVTTRHPVTVIDDGSGPELCLGGVAESLPPQCSGPKVAGWTWAGEFAESGGVRWGDYIVTGRYDPEADVLTATEVRSGKGYVWPDSEEETWTSACPEPAGGWRVTDNSKVSEEDLDAALSLAASFPDYSTAWADQSPNPASRRSLSPGEQERWYNDPLYTVLNIAVTGDVAAAEAKLRTVWSGMLCVSRGQRTEAELMALQERLPREVKGFANSSSDPRAGVVKLQVFYDDGEIQRALDEKFGTGLIVVTSMLEPV